MRYWYRIAVRRVFAKKAGGIALAEVFFWKKTKLKVQDKVLVDIGLLKLLETHENSTMITKHFESYFLICNLKKICYNSVKERKFE